MSEEMPDPLVPAELDLKDFPFMPIEVRRLLTSETWMMGSGDERAASVALWLESYHQVPAGSLPDNDRILAHLSQAGASWKRVRGHVLRGWVKCSDGRLYHRVVCEKALEAWLEKLAQRISAGEGNMKRWGVEFDRAGVERQMDCARAMLATLNPQSRSLTKKRTAKRIAIADSNPGANPDGITSGNPDGSPESIPLQSQEKRRDREGTSLLENPPSEPPARPSVPDCPQSEILALYAKHLPMLRQPRLWDGARADKLRTRWRYCAKPNGIGKGYGTQSEGIAFWEQFFAFVAQSRKLTDGIPYDNGTRWKPDLPWLLEAENFAKVVEGKFHEEARV